MKKVIWERYWVLAFEGEPTEEEKAAAAAAAEKAAAEKADGIKFTEDQQKHINKLIADERRNNQTSIQQAVAEARALQTRVKLSDSERKELDKRLENLQQEVLTKEEIAKREQQKLVKGFEKQVGDLSNERDAWKKQYTDSVITGSITSAASKHKAYNPNQLLAILKPQTELEEALDGEGKPTGELIPKVTLSDKDKDEKPVKLKLSVSDAVKRMAEMDEFANLFESEGVGGIGHRGGRGGGAVDIKTIATDSAKYREMKKKGLIKLD